MSPRHDDLRTETCASCCLIDHQPHWHEVISFCSWILWARSQDRDSRDSLSLLHDIWGRLRWLQAGVVQRFLCSRVWNLSGDELRLGSSGTVHQRHPLVTSPGGLSSWWQPSSPVIASKVVLYPLGVYKANAN